MGMIFVYPDKTASAARNALRVFGMDIVPTLFPYMVLIRMFVLRLKETSRSSAWITAILGWLGGSPSGASMIQATFADQTVPRRTLYTLCAFTGTISPVFLLNTVGAWFRDSGITLSLMTSHFAGALLSALAIYLYMLHDDTNFLCCSCGTVSCDAQNVISTCAVSVLGIGGCLVFYSVISEVVNTLLFKSDGLAAAFSHAALEISGGLNKLSEYTLKMRIPVGILSAFACGFSGLSMLSQNAMFLKELNVTMPQLIGIGILRALLSAGVMLYLLSFVYSS